MTCEFELGRVMSTAALDYRIFPEIIDVYIDRHKRCDWGDVSAEQAQSNDRAVEEGGQILSIYQIRGNTVWIITEADRSRTVASLANEKY